MSGDISCRCLRASRVLRLWLCHTQWPVCIYTAIWKPLCLVVWMHCSCRCAAQVASRLALPLSAGLQIAEMFRPHVNLVPVFQAVGADPKALYTQQQASEVGTHMIYFNHTHTHMRPHSCTFLQLSCCCFAAFRV